MCVWVCLTPDFRSMSVCVRMMLNTAWDLLLSSFIFVAATVRDLFPSDIRDSMSCQWHRRHKQTNNKQTNILYPHFMKYLGSLGSTTWWKQKTNRHSSWSILEIQYLVAGHCQARQAIDIRPKNAVFSHSQCLSTSTERRQLLMLHPFSPTPKYTYLMTAGTCACTAPHPLGSSRSRTFSL